MNYSRRFLQKLTDQSFYLFSDETTLRHLLNSLNVEVVDKFHDCLQEKLKLYHENTLSGKRPNLSDAFVEEKVSSNFMSILSLPQVNQLFDLRRSSLSMQTSL